MSKKLQLVQLYIQATKGSGGVGGLGWCSIKTLRCKGSKGGGRLTQFNPKVTPLWFFMDDATLDADDMSTLIADGYATLYINRDTGNYYTLKELKKDKVDYDIVSATVTANVKPMPVTSSNF